ncbi:MAG: amidase domain-containing protein [Alicyclobacillus sp.]|nr:amidase domain-containing protein [Alicyclobacillus sp.]
MHECLAAIRAYFDLRNRLWLGGNPQSVRPLLYDPRDDRLSARLTAAIRRKRQASAARQHPLLRAHTRITVRTLDVTAGTHNRPEVRRYDIEEHIWWVVQHGHDLHVEGRRIQHRQDWTRAESEWKLTSAWESDEVHLRPTQRIDGPAVTLSVEEAGSGDKGPLLPYSEPSTPALAWGRAGRRRYDRLRALRYAELWWDAYNPAFPELREDCTNFVSQCLWAGQLPMDQRPSRAQGWWMELGTSAASERWSYSWATAQALRGYLRQIGAKPATGTEALRIGDVIFYDWQGTGQFHHAAIVVDFDEAGDPLVNAHTDASYHRPYRYTDSRAWTPNTRYEMLHIPDTVD